MTISCLSNMKVTKDSSNSNKEITLASICKLVLRRCTMMLQSAICNFFASISVIITFICINLRKRIILVRGGLIRVFFWIFMSQHSNLDMYHYNSKKPSIIFNCLRLDEQIFGLKYHTPDIVTPGFYFSNPLIWKLFSIYQFSKNS